MGDNVITDRLPGKQGRLLLAFLAYNRNSHDRQEIIDAIWSENPPANPAGDLAALLSKLKKALGKHYFHTKVVVRCDFPPDTWIDTEIAKINVHKAESSLSQSNWQDTWVAAQVSSHILARTFLGGPRNDWADLIRIDLESWRSRALSCLAEAGLMLGGSELFTAERAARRLIEMNPYQENSWRLLMRALTAAGNKAEAIWQFKKLEKMLSDELGVTPSQETVGLSKDISKS